MFTYNLKLQDRDRISELNRNYQKDIMIMDFLSLIESSLIDDVFEASNVSCCEIQDLLNQIIKELNEQAEKELYCPFFSWLWSLETT